MSESESVRILVVDDEESMRRFLGVLLEREGYAVTCEIGGAEALARMEQESFDLLITDLKMPGMSGVELLEKALARESVHAGHRPDRLRLRGLRRRGARQGRLPVHREEGEERRDPPRGAQRPLACGASSRRTRS